jgi:hypothetical protein
MVSFARAQSADGAQAIPQLREPRQVFADPQFRRGRRDLPERAAVGVAGLEVKRIDR